MKLETKIILSLLVFFIFLTTSLLIYNHNENVMIHDAYTKCLQSRNRSGAIKCEHMNMGFY